MDTLRFLWLPEHPGAQMGHGPGVRRMFLGRAGDVVVLDDTPRNRAYVLHQLQRVKGELTFDAKGEPHRNPCLIECDGEGRPKIDGKKVCASARLAQAVGAQVIMRVSGADGGVESEVAMAPEVLEPPGHEPAKQSAPEPAKQPAFSAPMESDRKPAGKGKRPGPASDNA